MFECQSRKKEKPPPLAGRRKNKFVVAHIEANLDLCIPGCGTYLGPALSWQLAVSHFFGRAFSGKLRFKPPVSG